MIPVILSGGSGTRLWPLSRSQYPKQFLPLVSGNSMLQETMLRIQALPKMQAPIAICNEVHRFLLAKQLYDIEAIPSAIILEPMGKNTAPAVALAALSAQSPDDVLLILAADHIIIDTDAFHVAIDHAEALAKQGLLVTFGIVPNSPEIGYGYIKQGSALEHTAYNVEAFVEKPDLATANHYLQSGEYLWNSGMFAFTAGKFLAELEKFNPEMLECCKQALATAKADLDFIRLDKAIFSKCPSDSIDYAVMEKTDKAVVIPLDAGWNDVGSWSALWDVRSKDDEGNSVTGDVIIIDTRNSLIHAENKLVTVIGVDDLVVVETKDAVMIASKDGSQSVKDVVGQLIKLSRSEAETHPKVFRPWGSYDSVDSGDRYQTKLIVVNPGAKLSVQQHHHRAEHWIVVKGTAMVSLNDDKTLLFENESIYIPIGTIHCLENPGVIPLEVVEVQSGTYLGEDDIVRYSDQYGRV